MKTTEDIKTRTSYISPDLYKALKEREFAMELRIVELEERNKALLDIVEQQYEHIRKLNQIIDVLC